MCWPHFLRLLQKTSIQFIKCPQQIRDKVQYNQFMLSKAVFSNQITVDSNYIERDNLYRKFHASNLYCYHIAI